jgi:leucyl aminopeptidase
MVTVFNEPNDVQVELEIYLFSRLRDLGRLSVGRNARKRVKDWFEDDKNNSFEFTEADRRICIFKAELREKETSSFETLRNIGVQILGKCKLHKVETAHIVSLSNGMEVFFVLEGALLSSYSFDKYKKEKATLRLNSLFAPDLDDIKLKELNSIQEAVFFSRDLVNEPVNYLTAVRLAEEIKAKGAECGFSVEVLNKKKIESLKMGGLLAVNFGSIDPPSFSILEWKPENAINEKPIVLVGKGVVYDTGGLSLKPTAGSMDSMKSDMGGAAAVAGAFIAASRNALPLHVIGLIPATDNRPGGNAYAPGDIIKMYDGTTVEVLNTDAEGRMILADALSYAKKFSPEFVINLATLTGSAAAAIGSKGVVAMGNADKKIMSSLELSGARVHERLAVFPFWDDYKDLLKSPIADLKNIGGKEAGAITAGKFLEHFTDYPFIHLDIAGPAFLDSADKYRTRGGTAVGVRLLFDFLKNRS